MYSALRLGAKYLHYYITASSGKGHGIHSPFVYNFIAEVLNGKGKSSIFAGIETCRAALLKDQRLLDVEDFGAGSVSGNHRQRTVASIARNAAKSAKYSRLLFRIAKQYKPAAIIELGTSLGMSAAYLASGHPMGRLVTIEGSAAVADLAKSNLSTLAIKNAEVITGSFDVVLPGILEQLGEIDMAFVDGNHRASPTLEYFGQLLKKLNRPGVLIFDDIHWSSGMESAWHSIKNHPEVYLTIDLFFIGLVFFSSDFKIKQHFVIRF